MAAGTSLQSGFLSADRQWNIGFRRREGHGSRRASNFTLKRTCMVSTLTPHVYQTFLPTDSTIAALGLFVTR